MTEQFDGRVAPMNNPDSERVENLLARPEVHRQWQSGYRTQDNERFFEHAFDLIVRVLRPVPGATFLDAGCGSCAHAVRLARRGFTVVAVDFSESALSMAADYIEASGFEKRITLRRESLLELSFPDETFDHVVCWGVLMHVPEVERAIGQLTRVLKPGGFLVVSEGNMTSLEAISFRGVKQLLKREKAAVRHTPAGVEYWVTQGNDALVTRQADVNWLIRRFEERGLNLVKRVAGQFSEAYTRVSARPLKRAIHTFNIIWFRHVRLPRLAFGNILFLRKA